MKSPPLKAGFLQKGADRAVRAFAVMAACFFL
jgi:hypothetical protein